MLTLPDQAGPHDPVRATPPRRPGSVRRTSSIDSLRPDGPSGVLVLDGRARDLRTTEGGADEVTAAAELRVEVEGLSGIRSITSTPVAPGLAALVGGPTGSGYRARLAEAVPDLALAAPPLYLLLDDLPGASLVSGYAMLRTGAMDGLRRGAASEMMLTRADLCAGWVAGGAMMVAIRATGETPTPIGPDAPVLEGDDPLGWHEMAPLPPNGMRRRRRLDLGPPGADGRQTFDAHFRDSHRDADGRETVVHEYSVRGTVDGAARRLVDVAAVAQVLPWQECPGALASAGRLCGAEIDGLRPQVRREFSGVSTCTHLNDTLRTLADLGPLLAERVAS